MKKQFVGNVSSDHLALVKIFAEYQKALANGNADEFIMENCLRASNLEQNKGKNVICFFAGS